MVMKYEELKSKVDLLGELSLKDDLNEKEYSIYLLLKKACKDFEDKNPRYIEVLDELKKMNKAIEDNSFWVAKDWPILNSLILEKGKFEEDIKQNFETENKSFVKIAENINNDLNIDNPRYIEILDELKKIDKSIEDNSFWVAKDWPVLNSLILEKRKFEEEYLENEIFIKINEKEEIEHDFGDM